MGEYTEPVRTQSAANQAEISSPTTITSTNNTSLSINLALWASDLAGQINSHGMELDLKNHTDIGQENLMNIEAAWNFIQDMQLQLSYFSADHRGSTKSSMIFDGLNFSTGTLVRVRNNSFSFGLARVISKNENFTFNAVAGIVKNVVNTEIEQLRGTSSKSASINNKFTMPYIGLEGESRLSKNAWLKGAVKFFDRKHSGDTNRYSDYQLTLNFGRNHSESPAKQHWFGFVGYRYFMAHNDSGGNSAKVVNSGPKIGVRGMF
jgi:hypothetical protein